MCNLLPWSWSISCKFGCSKEDICNLLPWNGISNKDLELHATLKLKHFLKLKWNVKKWTFVVFYPETWSPGNTWKYIIAKGVRGVVPWSWSICVNPFYIERGVSNRDLEICYSKGGQGACPLKLKHFCKFGFSKEEICNIWPWKGRVSNKDLEIHYSKGGQGGLPPEAEAFL